MNLLNRIAIIVLCLALAAGAVAVIVLTWTMPDRSIEGLGDAVSWLERNNAELERGILTAIAAAVGLLAAVVLVVEIWPRSGPDVRVTDLKVGNAVLSTAAIGQRVEEAVLQVPNIAEVRAIVKGRRKGVSLSLDLHVDPEANLAEVTDRACETAQDVLNNRVHVALVEPPQARLHYRELRMRRRPPGLGSVRPPAQPTAAATTAAAPVAADAGSPDPSSETATARPDTARRGARQGPATAATDDEASEKTGQGTGEAESEQKAETETRPADETPREEQPRS